MSTRGKQGGSWDFGEAHEVLIKDLVLGSLDHKYLEIHSANNDPLAIC